MRKPILFKVEKRRVLVPVGTPCPFGCRYCYTRGGEVGLAHIDIAEILTRFQEFNAVNAPLFDTIQFGYDGDPFAYPERGVMMLRYLAAAGKHVNFSTKAAPTEFLLNALQDIRAQMAAQGTSLSALVSLSCWDSAASVEPHTPSPRERIRLVARLHQIDIPVFIAVRPILPHIADSEYERLFREGLRAGFDGFVLGPLYADDRGQFVRWIPPEALAATPHRRMTVSWSAHEPIWTRYEDEKRLQRLITIIERSGGRAFQSSVDALALANQKRKAA